MADTQKLLGIRKQMKAKKPHFKRQDWHKKARLAPSWRKPKGMDSKLRKHMHGHGHMPNSGYGSPALVRGMHKSGLLPVLVNNVKELAHVNAKTHGIIIASTVGTRKAIDIMTAAHGKNIRVLNFKDSKKFIESVKDTMAKRKQEKKTAAMKVEPKHEKKPETKKEQPVSQEEKKEAEKREAEKVLTGK
ncbi:MAG TPA: 50S ribosomal protein L32e [Candidatus Binatia bacterium]|nr:50S ribosomal protein L32e [Candidatus Binatia bacterium]